MNIFCVKHSGTYRRFIAEPTVFHETVSNDLHLDIYCWAPTKHRICGHLFVGMSAHEMNIPAGYEYIDALSLWRQHRALVAWPNRDTTNAQSKAKIRLAYRGHKNTARRPFYTNSWVGIGPPHRIDPPQGKYPGSSYSGLLLSRCYPCPRGSDSRSRWTTRSSYSISAFTMNYGFVCAKVSVAEAMNSFTEYCVSYTRVCQNRPWHLAQTHHYGDGKVRVPALRAKHRG